MRLAGEGRCFGAKGRPSVAARDRAITGLGKESGCLQGWVVAPLITDYTGEIRVMV